MAKLISIGEALVDVIKLGAKNIVKSAGGAPANVAATVSMLGGQSVLLTKIGDDEEGKLILETLQTKKVDTSYIKVTDAHDTTVADVSVDRKGQRTFTFDRRNAADLFLSASDIDGSLFQKGDIFHFGSVNLVPSLTRQAHVQALTYAKRAGLIISFDPNLRFNLWPTEEALRSAVKEFLYQVDILKITKEELSFIYPNMTESEALEQVYQSKVRIVIMSLGSEGVVLHLPKQKPIVIPGQKVKVMDTTGAGDALIGSFLYRLLDDEISKEKLTAPSTKLKDYAMFANKVAALVCTKPGAMSALPSQEELKKAKIK